MAVGVAVKSVVICVVAAVVETVILNAIKYQ